MAKSIGIDLGTTNSVAAIVKGTSPTILRNPESGELTRSVVSKIADNPDLIVGDNAYDFGLEYAPENTIRSIKRLMGRDFIDPNVQHMKDKYPFKIVKPSRGTERSVAVLIDGKEYSPEEISALIVGKFKAIASEALQQDELNAVITVPAYFNDKQKEATRKAGWLAGLKVQRILPEPTAAAISYGIDEVDSKDARTILVYDLGGGTFDVSILLIAGGAFVERGKSGDMWLGGDDFDEQIIKFVLEKTAEEYLIDDIDELISKMEKVSQDRFKFKLMKEAEESKKRLSTLHKTSIRLPGLLKDEDGMDIPINVEITRSQFESMIAPQIERTIEIIKSTMRDADLTIDDIDKILLVGGSTLIPLIMQRLIEEFGKEKILRSSKPMLAVAEGAAILSNRLGEKIECPNSKCSREIPNDIEKCPFCNIDLAQVKVLNVEIVGTLSHDYAVQVLESEESDGYEHVIKFLTFFKKGDSTPCRKRENIKTSFDNQRLYKLALYNIADGNEEWVATLWGSFPDGLPRGTDVSIELSITEDEHVDLMINIPKLPNYEVKKHIARGHTDEAFYLVFDGLTQKFIQVKNRLRTEEISEFWKRAEEFVNHVNKGSVSNADASIMYMKKKLGEEFDATAWERTANLYINYGEYILVQYNGILTPDQTYEYKRLIEQLKDELLKRNSEECAKLCSQVEEFEKTFDGWVWAIESVLNAARRVEPTSPSKSAQLEQAGRAILSDYKAERFDAAKQRMDSIWPDVKRIIDTTLDTTREFLLKK